MADDNALEFEGAVVQACGNGMFRVLPNDMEEKILCTLSGKIRKNAIKILEGDIVKISVSPYDPTKGRIIYRL